MFGDQNLFCRSSDFQRVGGYDQRIPIMEDLDLIMRLHAAGPSLSDPDLDEAPPSPHPGGSTTETNPGKSERCSAKCIPGGFRVGGSQCLIHGGV